MGFSEYIEPIVAENYEVRLLECQEELEEYQRLRYEYLLKHFDADGSGREQEYDIQGRDLNIGYDKANSSLCCFYIDPETKKRTIVGGYVLMRFRDDNTFCKAVVKCDMDKLLAKHKFQILELGRAVTHPDHRNGIVLKLLWAGMDAYAETHNLRYLIGTTNFTSLEPSECTHAYNYLQENYLMDADIMVDVLPDKALYPEQIEVDRDIAIKQLPPILRGYLLIGAKVGRGLYVDNELQSLAIFTILDRQTLGRYRLR